MEQHASKREHLLILALHGGLETVERRPVVRSEQRSAGEHQGIVGGNFIADVERLLMIGLALRIDLFTFGHESLVGIGPAYVMLHLLFDRLPEIVLGRLSQTVDDRGFYSVTGDIEEPDVASGSPKLAGDRLAIRQLVAEQAGDVDHRNRCEIFVWRSFAGVIRLHRVLLPWVSASP